jgi:hypothetical protein
MIAPASADNIFGLKFREKLVDIKKRHPEFKFIEKKIDANLENEKHFTVQGTDLNGTVIFSFIDNRHILYERVEQRLKEYKSADKQKRLSIQDSLTSIRKILSTPIENHLSVLRVVWIPEYPIPTHKLYKKFGSSAEEIMADDFSVSLAWRQGILAKLSDDSQTAYAILYELQYDVDN